MNDKWNDQLGIGKNSEETCINRILTNVNQDSENLLEVCLYDTMCHSLISSYA